MSEMTIQLRRNPETGKLDIIIHLDKDADLLPHEHESRHRELVEKLIEKGIVAESEAGAIVVERETPQAEQQPQAQKKPPARRDEGQRESS